VILNGLSPDLVGWKGIVWGSDWGRFAIIIRGVGS